MSQAPTASAISHEIADFVLASRWSALPAPVRAEALRAHLNWVACAIGGSRSGTAEAAVRALTALGAQGLSPVLGRRERFDMAHAAFLNGLHASAHAFDDTHLATITHPTAPVAAAAWAATDDLARQGRGVSGSELLHAIVLGIDIQCRISKALLAKGSGSDPGWYITGVSGSVGAAVTCARLMGLGHQAMVWAIGLAATQAGGLRATHASMASAAVPGFAARNGVSAAVMAGAGFDCGAGSIDGRNGLLQVMAPHASAEPIRARLGLNYELLATAYKPYPCGIVIHPVIDVCLELAARPGVRADQIESLDLRVHPSAIYLCGNKWPQTAMDTQVSLYHWAAASLLQRKASLEQSTLACALDEGVVALQQRIHAESDPALASDQASARLLLRDGRVLQAHVEHALGSIGKPMSDAQLDTKFHGLADAVLGAERATRLLTACRTLDQTDEPLTVLALASP